jgi:myo-inositol-1-phosphate synthase
MRHPAIHIPPPDGRLGVLLVGLGAVSTTFIAGVLAVRRGLAKPIGSLTQMGTVRLGRRTEHRSPPMREFLPLQGLESLVFGAWDCYPQDAYAAAVNAAVLEPSLLTTLRPELEAIKPFPAVFDRHWVPRLNGVHVKPIASHRDRIDALRSDIRAFKRDHELTRAVMLWCGSTESFHRAGPVHESLEAFERGLDTNEPAIAPSMPTRPSTRVSPSRTQHPTCVSIRPRSKPWPPSITCRLQART